MNLGQLYTALSFALGRDIYGGYLTPQNFTESTNNIVQSELMNDYIKRDSETRMNGEELRPFYVTLGQNGVAPMVLANSGGFGYAEFPADFWNYSDGISLEWLNACSGATFERYSLEWVSRADFNYRIGSELMSPRKDMAILSVQNNKVVCAPYLDRIQFTYVRRYANIVFDYDIVSGTVVYLPPGTFHTNSSVLPIGTPSQSVELEWPESTHVEILNRLVRWYGKYEKDQIDMATPIQKPE